MSAAGARAAASKPSPRGGLAARLDRLSEGRFALVAAAPGLLLVGLFIVPPVLTAIGLSFFRIELGSDSFTPFIGLRNYVVRLPADATFLGTLPLTLAFAVVTTVVSVPIALGAAALINGHRRIGGLLGLLLLLPWAVAPVADGMFWAQMFDPGAGLIDQALRAVGLPKVIIAQAPGALIAMVVAVSWRAIPLLGILFLGALRQVPADIGRAARMDGATAFQAFRRLTLPAIAPSLIAACLLQIILTLQVFDVQYAMSGDNPPRGALLAGLQIFHTVIDSIALGYGAAETMVLAAFIGLCLYAIYVFVIRPGNRARALEADLDDDDTSAGAWRSAAKAVVGSNGRPSAGTSDRSAPAERLPEPASGAFSSAVSSGRRQGVRGLRVAATLLLAIWLVGPIAWLVISSTQLESALQQFPPNLSLTLHLDSYSLLLGIPQWRDAAVTSVEIAVGATLLALVVAVLTAYPLARYRARGGQTLLLLLLGSQLIPPIGLAIPVDFIFARLGFRDAVPGLIAVNAAFWTPILVWLVRGAILAVPRNLELAARMDGMSRLGAIFRITLPAAGPGIAAAAAIVFVGIWNDFIFIAVLGGQATHTLPEFIGEVANPPLHVLAATIVLTVAPCIAIVAAFHRRILRLV